MKMTLREKLSAHQGAVVLKGFEDSDFWLVPFDANELEAWWTSQETFGLLIDQPQPPNKLHPPGRILAAKTGDDFDLWNEMQRSRRFYYCELCCDYDSFLQRPDGTRLYHKGFKGEQRGSNAVRPRG